MEATVDKPTNSPHPELTFVGQSLIVLKKPKTKSDHLRVSKFSGPENLGKFSRQIRLKYGLMDHHMPWSYNALFAGQLLDCLWTRLVSMILLQTWAARPLLTASVWRCWTSCRTPVPCQRLEVRRVVQLITSTPTFLPWKCKLVFSYSRSTYNCAKWQYCITYLFSSIEVNLLKSHISFHFTLIISWFTWVFNQQSYVRSLIFIFI